MRARRSKGGGDEAREHREGGGDLLAVRALRLGVCLGHGRDEPTSAWGARYVAAAGRLVGVVRRRRRAARGAHRGALGAVPRRAARLRPRRRPRRRSRADTARGVASRSRGAGRRRRGARRRRSTAAVHAIDAIVLERRRRRRRRRRRGRGLGGRRGARLPLLDAVGVPEPEVKAEGGGLGVVTW